MNSDFGCVESPRTWIKSSYSNGAGGECVECARVDDLVLVRDTKVGDQVITEVGAPAWRAFTRAMGRGWPELR
ncbi:DUF397 domain-containing protein [Streptomyces sp. JHA26]|uniref:DUF397 domain-containing protein n=1 Tax=Streptomyces sp. JHA26 TaxID=1917143 RepID=UPI00098A3E35|nr:DUF397 domain-containing protein [Streptomyces sp. JHA26]